MKKPIMRIGIVDKIKRKWIKFRFQTIRVFCFHQVSETFDTSTMYDCDWTQIEQFKANILKLKEQYIFISLSEAYEKLLHDKYRIRRYAVLTSDDGWKSLKNILPWLSGQQIPVTLFVNPAYLLGEEIRENNKGGLLSETELKQALIQCPNISIASHGWNHALVTQMNISEFKENVIRCHNYLSKFDQYIPYYAYPCGKNISKTDKVLSIQNILPVYMDGMKNYKYDGGIHRELLDGLCL